MPEQGTQTIAKSNDQFGLNWRFECVVGVLRKVRGCGKGEAERRGEAGEMLRRSWLATSARVRIFNLNLYLRMGGGKCAARQEP